MRRTFLHTSHKSFQEQFVLESLARAVRPCGFLLYE
jgi:hypothetical protein